MQVNCFYCGTLFIPKFFVSTRPIPKYCTVECMGKSFRRRIEKICGTCKKSFEIMPHNEVENNVCSIKCIRGNHHSLLKFMKDNPKKSFWKTATFDEKMKKYQLFYEKYVIKKEGCWGWKSFFDSTGAGVVGPSGYTLSHYKLSWLLHKGEIPNNLWVLHKCDNRSCSNPEHLYLGTAKDNARDRVERNKSSCSRQNSKNAKLNREKVTEIKDLLIAGLSYAKIAEKYNLKPGTIQNIKNGRTWRDI